MNLHVPRLCMVKFWSLSNLKLVFAKFEYSIAMHMIPVMNMITIFFQFLHWYPLLLPLSRHARVHRLLLWLMHFADLVINKGRSLVVVVMDPSNGRTEPWSSWWKNWSEEEWQQWRLEQSSATGAISTSPAPSPGAPAIDDNQTPLEVDRNGMDDQWRLEQSSAIRLTSTMPAPLPQTPAIDDGIRTPPTPPLSAFRWTHSDEEMFAAHGILRFVIINGTQSDDIKFDHVSSYGWLVQKARSWCKKDFFVLTFPLQDPTYNVSVSSSELRPQQSTDRVCYRKSTDRVCYRKYVDKIHQDCLHVMMRGKYLEVTVVAES